jgi:acyl carrier protein
MTISSLLSREQITAIKDHFAAVEITDADFNRIEAIGDLIRQIEIVDAGLPEATLA